MQESQYNKSVIELACSVRFGKLEHRFSLFNPRSLFLTLPTSAQHGIPSKRFEERLVLLELKQPKPLQKY